MTQGVAPFSTIVVVGAGLAGLKAVEGLRNKGFDGSLTLVGSESRLPYDRPPLSKGFLAGKDEMARLALTSEDKLASLGVEFANGETAVSLDLVARIVRLGSGRSLPFDGLVIATGATPRRLLSLGDLEGVMTLRRLEDSVSLRHRLSASGVRLVVVGGGFLGMEVAATARGLGADVMVVEPLATPLARVLGPVIGRTIEALHRDNGVELRMGLGVDSVEGSDRVERVRLSDGTTVEAEVVLVAIGVTPETTWLERSGLALDDGVICSSSLTAAPGVVAAGDLARFPHPLASSAVRLEHRTNAAEQGAHAAASLLAGDQAEPFTLVPYFWSDQYDVKIQSIGIPSPTDEVEVVAGSLDERRFVACCGRNGQLSAVVGFGMPREVMRFHPLLTSGAAFSSAVRFLDA